MAHLFDPVQLGDLTLSNRIIMAPLTRGRAGEMRIPNDLMREYYVQRASAGLILTEATSIMPRGVGYANTPGVWSEEQVQGWKKITNAVRAAGGKMFMQLWHVGRISHPIFLDGELPVAPSAIKAAGHVSLLRPMRDYVIPHELTKEEISSIVSAYEKGAENAKKAGFDGVEIHGANGYLPDQFLQSKTNQRTDEYGGSVENRARFLLEVTDAVIKVWGPNRVGVHLSPRGDSHDMGDDNPKETFGYAARELAKRKIAFIFLRERQGEGYLTPYLKDVFSGHIIANEGLTLESANALLTEGIADSASFGKLFISNPDLVSRLKANAPLQALNPSTIYTSGPEGYTDYPTL